MGPLSFILHTLNQTMGPGTSGLPSPPDDADTHSSLRATGLPQQSLKQLICKTLVSTPGHWQELGGRKLL